MKEFIGTGRRKTAVASVRLRKGKGAVNVNGSAIEEYFPSELDRKMILTPLEQFKLSGGYDLIVRIKGGGKHAQATAVRLGLSRALVLEDEDRRQDLKALGFLTRDPRKKERKKYGFKKARKSFQFSKR